MPETGSDLVARLREGTPRCSASEAARRLTHDSETILIDVREPEEHAQGAIEGAIHIPRGLLEFKLGDVCSAPDRSILIHCAAGSRAILATRALQELGYRNVCAVDGSFADLWVACGSP